MSGPQTIIVGAGLAGLAAALRLSARGRRVTLLEAAPAAGGRCRSFHDPALGRVIDNGNHLMMTANEAVFDYLAEVGALDRVTIGEPAAYPFIDTVTGARWTVRPNAGRVPWWVLRRSRSVPGARLRDWLAGLRLLLAGPDATVADCIPGDTWLWRRFWEPLSVAALNTAADEASAQLLAATCRLTFARGERWSRPVTVRDSLADTLIDPAIECLRDRGVEISFGERVRSMQRTPTGGAVSAIETSRRTLAVGPDDRVILAVPSWNLPDLLPDVPVPEGSRMILNLHFDATGHTAQMPPLTGLTGGVAQWLFCRDGLASVTVSAADRFADDTAEALARRIWPEVAIALGDRTMPLPAFRVVKERRATFAETPANEPRRPGPDCTVPNVLLAGDWSVRGLPATIEGAIRSGRMAADRIT
ncbi:MULTISPECIES: hydroxysqualene dehydroxylase HpnE [unclassified Minwuia]|jgi:hydroxysqualene dehydroxylase|uniref:hydroxysqualene dehydroxylase HpnE n=1 Tax=unclassified Minwuia TaxID=2618799 RepID=UPI00247A2F82|nr:MULTISPECIES: hydroxysqualene dehydroxylase HpnE [unclassified Minwuia]